MTWSAATATRKFYKFHIRGLICSTRTRPANLIGQRTVNAFSGPTFTGCAGYALDRAAASLVVPRAACQRVCSGAERGEGVRCGSRAGRAEERNLPNLTHSAPPLPPKVSKKPTSDGQRALQSKARKPARPDPDRSRPHRPRKLAVLAARPGDPYLLRPAARPGGGLFVVPLGRSRSSGRRNCEARRRKPRERLVTRRQSVHGAPPAGAARWTDGQAPKNSAVPEKAVCGVGKQKDEMGLGARQEPVETKA